MKLLSARYVNVFTFKDTFFDFRLINFALFRGRNGVGKSYFFDALCLALYGVTPRKKYKSVLRDTPKRYASGFVEIEFETDCVYKVERKFGRGKCLNLYKNGTLVQFRLSSMVQEEIEKIIGMNFKTFLNVCYFSQGDIGKFLSSDSNDRINIISDILDLLLFDDARKSISNDMRKYETRLNILRSKLSVYTSTINLTDVKKLSKLKKMAQVVYDSSVNETAKISFELNSTNEKIKMLNELALRKKDYIHAKEIKEQSAADYKRNIVYWKSKQVDTKSLIVKLKGQNAKYKKAEEISEEIKSIKESMQKMQLLSSKLESRNDIFSESLQSLIEVIKLKGSRCPTCKIIVSDNSVKYIESEIERLKTKIADNENKIARNDFKINEGEDLILDMNNELKKYESIKKNIADIELKIKNAHYAIFEQAKIQKEYNNEKIKLADKVNNAKKEYKKIKQDLEHYKEYDAENIEILEKKWNDNQNKIYESESRLKLIRFKLNQHNTALSKSKKISEQINSFDEKFNIMRWWYDNYPKIKLEMINEVIPFIEAETNKYLSQILPGRFIKFLLDTDKKNNKLELIIKDYNTGIERAFEGWSGGQRDRMALAVYLALNKMVSLRSGKSINFLILDEKFVGVDTISIPSILELLKTENKYRKIFVISHIEKIESIFKQVVTVTNKNGVSNFEITNNKFQPAIC